VKRGERAIEIPAAVAEPIAMRADAERRDQQGVGSEYGGAVGNGQVV
jgi:hypothetical protein